MNSSLQSLGTDRIENTVSKNNPIFVGVFTDKLLRNGLHNPVGVLLNAYCGRYLATAAV
jgi:hypothetical protein